MSYVIFIIFLLFGGSICIFFIGLRFCYSYCNHCDHQRQINDLDTIIRNRTNNEEIRHEKIRHEKIRHEEIV